MARLLISLVIIALLALQTIAIFGSHLPRLWPFVDYPMYSAAFYEHDIIDHYYLFGILKDDTEVLILPEDLGLGFFKFLWRLVPAVKGYDREKLETYIQLYWIRHNKQMIGMRLENHPVAVSKEGLTPAPPQIVKTIWLGSGNLKQE